MWLYGFLADFCGIIYLITFSLTGLKFVDYEKFDVNSLGYQIWEGIHLAMNQSHFDSIWGVIFICSGILFAALAFAIITAPYTFLLPKSLFY